MIEINFHDADGTARTVAVDPRGTVMEAAMLNNVPGIVAECGGGCSCATCHVYVDEQWLARLPEPAPEETELVEFLDGARANSRLSCSSNSGPNSTASPPAPRANRPDAPTGAPPRGTP